MASRFDAVRNRQQQGEKTVSGSQGESRFAAVRSRTDDRVRTPEMVEKETGQKRLAMQEQRLERTMTKPTPQTDPRMMAQPTTPDIASSLQRFQSTLPEAEIPKTAYERWYEENIGDTVVGKALGGLWKADRAVSDAKAGAMDTATFGLTQGVGRATLRGVPEGEKLQPIMDERTKSTAYKVGEIAGYIPPGALIERGVARAAAPLLKNTGTVARGAATGAAAGLIEGVAQEVGDVAFRERNFDPANVAIGGAAGGVLGGAAPLVSSAIGKLFRRNGVELPEEEVATILALPAGRTQPGVNVLPKGEEPILAGAGATTARIQQRTNPWRDRYNELIGRAHEMKFTPGRELEELESLWSQMATKEDPSLDDLIKLAHPTHFSKAQPGLVSKARQTQQMRAAAGVPSPVRTSEERLGVAPASLTEQRMPANVDPATPQPTPRQIQTPQPVQRIDAVQRTVNRPPATAQRGFIGTLQASGKLNPSVSKGLAGSKSLNRKVKHNVNTVAIANRRIDKDADSAEAMLNSKKNYTPEDVATGMRLIDKWQNSGQHERAITMAENLADRLTKAGQTVQAASIWNRLTPEGALVSAQRKVKGINENLLKGETPVKITPQQSENIKSAAAIIQATKGSQERAGRVMEIMDRAKKGETISAEERQFVAEFVTDAKQFVKPSDARPVRPARAPSETTDKRVRDRVLSALEAQEKAAKERLRAKGVQISSNPLDIWADYAYIGALKLAKGAVKFSDWSEQMVKEGGEAVRPHLQKIYEKSQEIWNQSAKKVNEQTISKAERIAEGYIKSKQLATEDADFIRNMAQKVSALSGKEQQLASQDLQAILNGFERAGIGRKISAAQYTFMLLNPKTQVRNIAGNELMYRLERMARWVATPIDIAASKLTGGPRTITFKSGPTIWEDFFKPAQEYWSNLATGMKAGARGVSPEGLTSKYEIQGQAFRSKYNPMTYLEKALGASLQGFDYASYTRATNQRMREMAYLDAINSGIKDKNEIRSHMQTFMANLDDGVHQIASNYGKYVTLQDDSLLAKKLTGFRRGFNQLTAKNPDFGLGSLVLPFAKTPANLLLRAIDYSPAGILKAASQAYDIMRKPNTDLTRADVISSVSRALMGTGMGAMAYWLADKGVMSGQLNSDPETRKLQQMVGVKDFQINGSALYRMLEAMVKGEDIDTAAKMKSGDTLWSYEWAQPTSMPMAVGSNIHQGVKGDKSALQTGGEAVVGGLNTLLNSSVLSGIREAFEVPTGEDNSVIAIGENLIKSAPSMFTPTILRNINTYLDNRVKETYTPDEIGGLFTQSYANVPGLSDNLPQRVDTLGQPQTKPNSFLDVFVLPADRSKYKPSKEAQLVMDLLAETDDKRVAPRAVAKYLNGTDKVTGLSRKVELTTEQYVRLQTLVGQESAKRIAKIDPKLPTEKKVEKIIKALDEAGKIGRNEIKKEVGLKLSK